MSRLCRLKTKTHGEDGLWAYNEIVMLRKQRDELVKALEHERSIVAALDIVKDKFAWDTGSDDQSRHYCWFRTGSSLNHIYLSARDALEAFVKLNKESV